MTTAATPSRPRAGITAVLAHIVADPASYHAALRHGAYTTFQIPKADGGTRTIHAPSARLKAAHREALRALQEANILRTTDADHGFAEGRGIHTMLRELQPGRRFIQADLERAFHQVTDRDIRAWATAQGANGKTARWLAQGLTQPVQGLTRRRLVMGSPLAPAMLLELTRSLRRSTERLAAAWGGRATWYADNVVLEVSARHAGRARRALARLLKGQRWSVKAEPAEHPRVLGWNWHGLQGVSSSPNVRHTGHTGWRLSKARRGRIRARSRRFQALAELAEARGNPLRGRVYRERAAGLLAYGTGPAAGRPLAPTYTRS